MTGTTLSQYRILEVLGRGGMGTVYKAEDTKLERQVALKVLPAAALASEDDRARFYREAKAAAALNHPNIAAIHQIDEAIAVDADGNQIEASDGPRPFIAMEFIEGGTLEDKIKAAPLKLDVAVRIATQVADALKAAHDKDIVHRDIKSANIMLSTDGQAKVLDFGLAQTAHSTKLTRMGSTLGTVAYMSPEQARGEEVDQRTDLWAIGVVLYEMISGQHPFGSDYEQAVIYNILNQDPEPLTALRTGVPMPLESVTSKALRKQATQRYQTAADLIADLDAIDLSKASGVTAIRPASVAELGDQSSGASRQSGVLKMAAVAIVSVLLGVVASSTWGDRSGGTIDDTVRRFHIDTMPFMNADYPSISPRGDAISFEAFDTSRGVQVLALHDLLTMETRVLAEESDIFHYGFSPDGEWLLFGVPNGLRIVRTTGGQPLEIADASFAFGSWENNEAILYRAAGALFRVGVDGAPPQKVASTDSTRGHDGIRDLKAVVGSSRMFATLNRFDGGFDLALFDTESGEYEVILEDAVLKDYTSNGILLYRSDSMDGPLRLRKYDIQNARFESRPIPVPVEVNARGGSSIGENGSLVMSLESAYSGSRVFDMDLETGAMLPLQVPPGQYQEVGLSDDGRYLTFEERMDSGQNAVMVIDLENGTKTRVSGTPRRDNPLFLDNDTIIFDSRSTGERKLYRQPIRGGAAQEIVTENSLVSEPFLHPDGDRVVYRHIGDDFKDEIRAVSLSTGEEEVLAAPNRLVFDPSVSPDGRFVAYETVRSENGSSINEVHVSAIDVEGSWVVGTGPTTVNDHVWSHDGKYLYFSDADVLYRVRILEGSGFSFSRKEVVATVPPGAQMALDTRRNRAIVVALEAAVNPQHVPIRLVQNYASSLENLIPESE